MSTLTLSDRISRDDPTAHSRVISALKRAFSRSATVKNLLAKHRREEVWSKKDGSVAKKPKVFYVCNHCKKEFRSNGVQVDHIDPVVPLNIPAKHLSYNTIISRLFCDEANLQILCKQHHHEKSVAENLVRDSWLVKTKFIVYETVNAFNNKRYIGVHKCVDYDDVYFGSGTLLRVALKKYGKDSFYRMILFVYDNAAEAFQKEHELVNSDIIASDNYYNLAHGGSGNVPGTFVNNTVKVICHQTGVIYDSINDVATAMNVSASSISRALNDPHQPVCGLHFFRLSDYDENVLVTFPTHGRPVVHLNTRTAYESLTAASMSLLLDYRSLRNAMRDPGDDGICSLNNHYFIYLSEYCAEQPYFASRKRVRLVELDRRFDTCVEAAKFLGHKNPAHGGIAIGKAIRTGRKMYGYTWESVNEKLTL